VLLDEQTTSKRPRVWLRAFWGFNPENEGYVGFTKAGDRERFLREYQDGDLILIYGADQEQTERENRRQVLGFLEVEPTPITDVERSSDPNRLWKVENGWQNRWTHGVPVKRAWRINRRLEAHHLAQKTFDAHNPVLIASRGELLTPDEARLALSLPVTPVNVFGEPATSEDARAEATMASIVMPSRGVTPSFGPRSFEVEDAENHLYLLRLEGDAAAFLGRKPYEVMRKVIVKIGYAKEPKDRCEAHNAHLPPRCQFRWRVLLKSKPFPGGVEAKAAEDSLKAVFAKRFESLGGEFFLGDQSAMETEFSQVVRSVAFVIAAS
jgi:hypothetical protein